MIKYLVDLELEYRPLYYVPALTLSIYPIISFLIIVIIFQMILTETLGMLEAYSICPWIASQLVNLVAH